MCHAARNAHACSGHAGSVSFDVDSSCDATVAAEGSVPTGPPADAFRWETPSKFPELPVCGAGPGQPPWPSGFGLLLWSTGLQTTSVHVWTGNHIVSCVQSQGSKNKDFLFLNQINTQ